MRPKVTENEKMAITHALIEEYGRIKNAKGDHYGPLTLRELSELTDRLFNEEDPIEVYLYKDHCPVCRVHLCYGAVLSCPKCGEEWNGDKVLKTFY